MASSPFSYVRYRWLFSLGWMLWIAIHVWVLYSYGWSESAAVADSLISNGLLVVASLGITTTLRFYLPSTNRYVYLFVLAVVLSLVWFVVCRSALVLLPYDQPDYKLFWSQTVPLRLAVGFLLLGSITLVHVLWYTLQQHREDDQRKNEMEKLARDAELFHLREQLHPHFLFNSLNSINALIGTQPVQARAMIQQLSDFLRGTLRKDHQQWNLMSDELHHLQLYLDIEKVRFGHRLQTVVTCSDAAMNARIPAMLLQPVVENAIKFGLYDTTESVKIVIEAGMEKNQLLVAVRNPFDAQTVSRKQGTGFGLRSIERRLYLLFAQTGLLQTTTSDNQFVTALRIPQPS